MTMKNQYYILSISLILVLLTAFKGLAWNSATYEIRPVTISHNLALTNAEPDLYLETNPLRYNQFPHHPEFLLIKHDPGPFVYWNEYYGFRPGLFSNRLFIYGNEFIDVGDGTPGMMGSYLVTKRRMFLFRMGSEIFVLLLDLVSDIYLTTSMGPQFYCYNGSYGYYSPGVRFNPRPIVEIAPPACVIPVRGPIGTSNSGGGGLVLDDRPVLPRVLDVNLHDKPTTVDQAGNVVPSRGNTSAIEAKGKKKYYYKDQQSYSKPASEKSKNQNVKFKRVDYEDRMVGDYSKERELVESESRSSSGSRSNSKWSKPSKSRSYQPSRTESNSNSRSSSYSRPTRSGSNSNSSSYSQPGRSTPSPSRSRNVSRPSSSRSGGNSSSYSKPRTSNPSPSRSRNVSRPSNSRSSGNSTSYSRPGRSRSTPSRSVSSPKSKPASKKPASRPSPSRSGGKRGIK